MVYKVLSSFGETHLEGVDIDNAIYEYVLKELKEKCKDVYEECFGHNININKRNNTNKLKHSSEAKINYNTNSNQY